MIHIKNKLTLLSVLFSFIILFFIIYKSEIVFDGARRGNYYGYFIIAFIIIFMSSVQIFLSQKNLIIYRIVFSSIFFSLYAFELYLTVNSSDHHLLNTNKKEYYKEYIKKNPNAVSMILKNNFEVNGKEIVNLGGISNKLTLNCKELDYWAEYKSDRYGFNNPDFVWEKTQNTTFIIGDSFIQGACVNDKSTIQAKLRKFKKDINVISLGLSENSLISDIGLIKEYTSGYEVKNIFIFYSEGNDLIDLEVEYRDNILKIYLYEKNFNQDLKNKQQEIDKNLIRFLDIELSRTQNSYKGKFYKFLTLYNFRNTLVLPYIYTGNIGLFTKVIKRLEVIQEETNSKIFFVYSPEYFRFKVSEISNQNYKKKGLLESIIKASKISYVDLSEEVFSKIDDPLSYFPYRRYGHYTEEAYEEIALIIKKYIKD